MSKVLPKTGKVKVLFHNGADNAGQQPIKASLNGNAILIPRNQEVVLDVAWLHGVFADAQTTEYNPGPGGRGIDLKPRMVPRYPYEVVEVMKDSEAPEVDKKSQK